MSALMRTMIGTAQILGKEALNSLICRVEWRWILSVMVGEAVHELHVEVCVRVTNRQQNFSGRNPQVSTRVCLTQRTAHAVFEDFPTASPSEST